MPEEGDRSGDACAQVTTQLPRPAAHAACQPPLLGRCRHCQSLSQLLRSTHLTDLLSLLCCLSLSTLAP